MTESSTGYLASATKPAWSSASVPGRLRIFNGRVRFEAEFGEIVWDLDQVRMTREADGSWQLTCESEPESCVQSFDDRLAEDMGLLRNAHIRLEVMTWKQQQETRRAWKATWGFLVVFLVVMVGGKMLVGWSIRRLAFNLPVSYERQLGETVFDELSHRQGWVQDSDKTPQVVALAAPLLESLSGSSEEFRFAVVHNSQPNAFALPGGRVVVYSGLLQFVEQPEELAGVLAHEMAHVLQRHSLQQHLRDAGPMFVLSTFFGNQGRLPGFFAASSLALVSFRASRDMELEADNLAWDYLVRANIDPRGLTHFLQKLRSQGQDGSRLGVWSTHPPTDARIRNLESKWASLSSKTGFRSLPAL